MIRRTFLLVLTLVLAAVLAVGGLGLASRLEPTACWPYGDRTLQVATLHLEGEAVATEGVVEDLREAYPGRPVFRLDSAGGTVLAVGGEAGAPDLSAAEDVLARHGVADARPGGGSYYQSAPDWFSPERFGHDLVWATGALLVSAGLVGWGSSRRRHRRSA